MSQILHIVGTRPNFVKAAPVIAALNTPGTWQTLIHTGQHYDPVLSDVFFKQLGLPIPDLNLNVGSASHTVQTARIMINLEQALSQLNSSPDWVVVYGDVNSTLAAALVCAKIGLPFAHVEAGLRSGNRTMPEEINRRVIDSLADMLLTPSEDADANLQREGIDPERVKRVGNVMIDSLFRLLPFADAASFNWPFELPQHFALFTLHRPENVDQSAHLQYLLEQLITLSHDYKLPIIFPVHPRTRTKLNDLAINWPPTADFRLIDPLGYLQFIALERRATVVITDSGGVQEETTALGVPCLTIRDSTERPVTVTLGTNRIVGKDGSGLRDALELILNGKPHVAHVSELPSLWDGHAADRIAALLRK